MGLQSTLFTGVSGLQANALRLSVIGNNIANVNTIGFKVARANFNEYLVQRIQAAKRPLEGVRGGMNPLEYGLGVGLSSIDNLFTQGTLESTGVTTDLAIDGDGFFVVREGQKRLAPALSSSITTALWFRAAPALSSRAGPPVPRA